MKAFFTGHRWINREHSGWRSGVKQLINLALTQGVTEFLIGMALGTDQLAAEILTQQQLKWTAVIPCADQDALWTPRQRSHYRKLLERANQQIVLYPHYSPGVMQARNLWMVKRSHLCLAVYNLSSTGGTAMTVKLAYEHNLQVIIFNPSAKDTCIIYPKFEQLSLF